MTFPQEIFPRPGREKEQDVSFKESGKWIKAALCAVGLLLFLYLVRRIGLQTLWTNLSRFGPWFLLTCLLAAVWLFFQAGAWYLVQNAFFQRVPLISLFRIKIISDALNMLLPLASLGGDAVRAFLIKKDVPLREGIPGVLFDKTIEFVAATLFLMSGFLLALIFIPLPGTLMIPVIVCLGITIVGVVLLVFFQMQGVYRTLVKLAGFIPKVRGWIQSRESQFLAMDQNLRLLYTCSKAKIGFALGLHILARIAGLVEVMVILAVLKAPVNFVQALFISTVVTAGNSLFFLLPGQWGVMESSHILVVQSLGYPAAIGLSLSIIRRIRKLAFVGLGLIFFASGKRKLS